ncbi:MAG: hypothetical protein AAF721_19040 [Myxococcota bacterium]
MLFFRLFALGVFGLAAASTVSCTAIFAPRDDVQRCGSGDDCQATGDNRYIAQCIFDDENLDLDTSEVQKICVAAFNGQIGCDPMTFSDDDDFKMFYETAVDSATFYSPDGMTCADLGGVLGCPPAPGEGCAAGLEENASGVCGDGTGTVYSTLRGAPAGQDVLDQYCRSFFCDESFICDETLKCVPCDPDEAVGNGGCGEIYIAGSKSCVYQEAGDLTSSSNCADPVPTGGLRPVNFGCAPS